VVDNKEGFVPLGALTGKPKKEEANKEVGTFGD
jgi:hypothetical protein